MHRAQIVISEIKSFIKRRRFILIFAPLLTIGLSISTAYLLPPKYESSISFLVDRDETLNPMIQYNMAVAMASEDRLRSFNEIIYSRSTMNILIDSLDLAVDSMTNRERENLIRNLRGDVRTNLRASDSFSITFLHADPLIAQKGVNLLAEHFIHTRLKLENRRNDQTVAFFEYKLNDLEEAVREREQMMMAAMENNIEQIPAEDISLRADINEITTILREIEREMDMMNRAIKELRSVNHRKSEIESLRGLELSRLPSGGEMEDLLNELREHNQRYTASYPLVEGTKNKIYDLSERIIHEIETVLYELGHEKAYLNQRRSEMVDKLKQVSFTRQESSGVYSDYDIYKTLLDDMKVKVEQARSTRDLGERSVNQFVVIDSANVPISPSKPNRLLLIAGGVFIGLFMGIFASGVAEITDPTIRNLRDLNGFDIPVVAWIPNDEKKPSKKKKI